MGLFHDEALSGARKIDESANGHVSWSAAQVVEQGNIALLVLHNGSPLYFFPWWPSGRSDPFCMQIPKTPDVHFQTSTSSRRHKLQRQSWIKKGRSWSKPEPEVPMFGVRSSKPTPLAGIGQTLSRPPIQSPRARDLPKGILELRMPNSPCRPEWPKRICNASCTRPKVCHDGRHQPRSKFTELVDAELKLDKVPPISVDVAPNFVESGPVGKIRIRIHRKLTES